MDEEYSKTEEGREEEERLENLIERVDEGFGNVPSPVRHTTCTEER